MSIQALELTPPLKKSPNDMSPAIHFGARRHFRVDAEGHQAGHVAEDFNVGQALEPAHFKAGVPGYYPGMGMPNGMHVNPGPHFTGMPDAQQ